MHSEVVIQHIERLVRIRDDQAAAMADLEVALVGLRTIRAFCDAAEADIAHRIAAGSSFPEATIAKTSRQSLGSASKTIERSRTLDAVPIMADALNEADVTAGHIDVVTRAANGLNPDERQRLYDRVERLADIAATVTVEQFGRRIRTEVRRIQADDGMARLEKQRRATSMSTWTDDAGMWNVRGRFDPVTALSVSAALDRAAEALFAEEVLDTCPSDPIEKQKHLRALAFARLAEGSVGNQRARRPEFVAVIDLSRDDSRTYSIGETAGASANANANANANARRDNGGRTSAPEATWPIPVEVPTAVLAHMVRDADVHTVVVRDGVVLRAPGTLDLGRTTRLASRAQRRALRGLYSACAIPGCSVPLDRCKIHHIEWWRHGGRTDLANLLPVCSKHHTKIHRDDWSIRLGSHRELSIRFPDGTVRNTGPPTIRAA